MLVLLAGSRGFWVVGAELAVTTGAGSMASSLMTGVLSNSGEITGARLEAGGLILSLLVDNRAARVARSALAVAGVLDPRAVAAYCAAFMVRSGGMKTFLSSEERSLPEGRRFGGMVLQVQLSEDRLI